MKSIALVGYMGCGKTYWGKRLANHLNISFLDLDAWLVDHALNASISNYISQYGELSFRKKERKALKELSQHSEQMVLSTGGGTPCYYDNLQVLNANFTTVYLECSINTLTQRVLLEKEHRPLVAHLQDAEVKEFIAKHLFERRHFYSQAKIKVKADFLNIDELLSVIENYDK